MIFDVTGDILADGSQLKHLVFDGRIVCLLGELPIHVGLIPEIIRPIHGRALGLHQPERELTISTARADPDTAMVEVCDTGTGLDPGHVDRLFQSFYTTKAEGMGMGLAISRSIVEAHGGRLEAAPNEPHGAVFRFTLPTKENAQASPEVLRS